jgi:hypothetical protein
MSFLKKLKYGYILDYYSSTVDALTVFDDDPANHRHRNETHAGECRTLDNPYL